MSRSERIAKYGSFLFCPAKETICSEMDSDDGVCKRTVCFHDDPSWINLQERIAENVAKNAERERIARAKKEELPAPIRRQTKTPREVLEEKIHRKEKLAGKFYRENKPRAGDSVNREIMALRARLRKMR